MLTYENLTAEFRLTNDGDDWGHLMQWLFSVADEIYWNRDDLEVPEEWQFRPSPMGPQNEPGEYHTEIVQAASDEALMRFGKALDGAASILKAQGRDY